MLKQIVVVFSMLAASMLSVASAEADVEAGKARSAACAGCHGVDGNSLVGQFPKLAGQSAAYIVKQLQDFKSGARANAIMAGMSASLSQQDMENIAAYYASQESTTGKAKPELVELGQSIYRAGIAETKVSACTACHGPRGEGVASAGFPKLSGQHPEYIETQLRAFRSGERNNDPQAEAGMMRGVVKYLSDEEIKALAQYVYGLH